MSPLLSYIELGAASGLRSMAAISQLSRTLADDDADPPGRAAALLSRPWARSLTQLMAAGEMVADKLPIVPDRTDPGPLAGRAVNGAIAGQLLARHRRESAVLGALVGALGAVAATHVGFRVRRALTARAGLDDLPVALCEDALAIALARHALAGWSEDAPAAAPPGQLPAGQLRQP